LLPRVEERTLPLFNTIPELGWELSQDRSIIEKLAAF
jgi:hypothetical protein